MPAGPRPPSDVVRNREVGAAQEDVVAMGRVRDARHVATQPADVGGPDVTHATMTLVASDETAAVPLVGDGLILGRRSPQ